VPRLREAAHKLAGMVAAFSTAAGGVASELEDRAAQGELEEAQSMVARLETMAEDLMRLVHGLSLEAMRDQMGGAAEPRPDRRPVRRQAGGISALQSCTFRATSGTANLKELCVPFPLRIILETELHRKRLVPVQGLVDQLHCSFSVSRVPLPLADSITSDDDREERLARAFEGCHKQVLELAHGLHDVLPWEALIVGRFILPRNREKVRKGGFASERWRLVANAEDQRLAIVFARRHTPTVNGSHRCLTFI